MNECKPLPRICVLCRLGTPIVALHLQPSVVVLAEEGLAAGAAAGGGGGGGGGGRRRRAAPDDDADGDADDQPPEHVRSHCRARRRNANEMA